MAAITGDIEPDDDSAIGGNWEDDTESLRSSILGGVLENGRRYHYLDTTRYNFPDDPAEQMRLNFQHGLFHILLNRKLCLSPIQDPQHVLDLGTGTGIWAVEFADQHPESQVCGIDISPIQPTWVPPNCSFEVDNYILPWNFQRKHDFIFLRLPFASITDDNLRTFLGYVWDNLPPGGYFEVQDACPPTSDDHTIRDDSPLQFWRDRWCEALRKLGCNPYLVQKFPGIMKEMGFVSVQDQVMKVPQNQWPKAKKHKELGKWNQVNLMEGIEGLSLRPFTEGLGWSELEVKHLVEKVRCDIQDRSIHAYWPIHIVYGQKPVAETQ